MFSYFCFQVNNSQDEISELFSKKPKRISQNLNVDENSCLPNNRFNQEGTADGENIIDGTENALDEFKQKTDCLSPQIIKVSLKYRKKNILGLDFTNIETNLKYSETDIPKIDGEQISITNHDPERFSSIIDVQSSSNSPNFDTHPSKSTTTISVIITPIDTMRNQEYVKISTAIGADKILETVQINEPTAYMSEKSIRLRILVAINDLVETIEEFNNVLENNIQQAIAPFPEKMRFIVQKHDDNLLKNVNGFNNDGMVNSSEKISDTPAFTAVLATDNDKISRSDSQDTEILTLSVSVSSSTLLMYRKIDDDNDEDFLDISGDVELGTETTATSEEFSWDNVETNLKDDSSESLHMSSEMLDNEELFNSMKSEFSSQTDKHISANFASNKSEFNSQTDKQIKPISSDNLHFSESYDRTDKSLTENFTDNKSKSEEVEDIKVVIRTKAKKNIDASDENTETMKYDKKKDGEEQSNLSFHEISNSKGKLENPESISTGENENSKDSTEHIDDSIRSYSRSSEKFRVAEQFIPEIDLPKKALAKTTSNSYNEVLESNYIIHEHNKLKLPGKHRDESSEINGKPHQLTDKAINEIQFSPISKKTKMVENDSSVIGGKFEPGQNKIKYEAAQRVSITKESIEKISDHKKITSVPNPFSRKFPYIYPASNIGRDADRKTLTGLTKQCNINPDIFDPSVNHNGHIRSSSKSFLPNILDKRKKIFFYDALDVECNHTKGCCLKSQNVPNTTEFTSCRKKCTKIGYCDNMKNEYVVNVKQAPLNHKTEDIHRNGCMLVKCPKADVNGIFSYRNRKMCKNIQQQNAKRSTFIDRMKPHSFPSVAKTRSTGTCWVNCSKSHV